jgi:tetratricopeptide (TPR) repeat protein
MEFPEWEVPENALEYAAVKLFMNSAKRVRPNFELKVDNLDFVAQICNLVQGMPLGIVLAASWLGVLSLAEIADEVQQSLDFLETDETELPERQRSIRAVMDYSWEQMTEAEQQVFMKLSVFRGGFTREAGQQIAGANLRILMSLVNKSLIQRDSNSGRYTVHELLRQYAEEHLQQSDELDDVNDQHMTYFANFLAIRTPDIKGRRQLGSLHEIQADFNNISVAWDYASTTLAYDALDNMMECLAVFFWIQGLPPIATELFEDALLHIQILANPDHQPIRNRLRVWLLLWYSEQRQEQVDDPVRAEIQLHLQLAEQIDDQLMIFLCLLTKGIIAADGLLLPSEYDQALNLSRGMGDIYYEGMIIGLIANYYTYSNLSEEEARKEYMNQHLEITRVNGDMAGQASAYFRLLHQAKFFGSIVEGENYLNQAIAIYQQMGNVLSVEAGKSQRSNFFFMKGEFSRAKEILSHAIIALSDLDYFYTHPYIYMMMGRIEGIEEDYEASQISLNHALSYSPPVPRHIFHIYECMALCSIGLNDFATARQHVSNALDIEYSFIGARHIINFLPQFAFLYHNDNQSDKAVALLGLTYSHPTGITMWMEKWDLLTQLQADLKNELGEEAFNTAWERGKSLDLETVVQKLILEFGNNQS